MSDELRKNLIALAQVALVLGAVMWLTAIFASCAHAEEKTYLQTVCTASTCTVMPMVYTSIDELKCVTAKQVLESWESAVSTEGVASNQFVLTVCNPCSCPTNGMANCYDYLADKERRKQEQKRQTKSLIDRFAKYGVCHE